MTEKPNFCRDCIHFNNKDTACDHPKNVKRRFDYDLVNGSLLAHPSIVRTDSCAASSRIGESKDTNCGYDAAWYETNLPALAEMALERR